MKNERLKFWFTVILVASVLGGIFLFMNNRLYVLRMEVDDLSEEAVAQEEVARQLQEDWMLSTAPESLQSMAAERLELDVPAELETVTVY
ncbi:MAG: hypothetical protein A2Y64_07905 [Candidatus Coatesbacteria bacterium RBG_13_66_14]|uniref:Cell division protein FtsL n=1 Tax=Candidatus Coatesbacteria bacterium RBG_13_66_14 TaxID=1817816 RepID=A0A1F5FIY8_9BACT|nr:MAG: hypothetical protein A2Y64_07905 [Candidatus Coatesbacteria bacterium RBG_13_66_14]